ncbi:hypothetical protein KEM52_002684 [Ascosphaera acerosa]|nr:hypothetical protein KEM52_002684 [Ascosphaera acerosa]
MTAADMTTPRAIRMAFHAIEVSEGAGARVRRSIGTPKLRHFSPFLMLDHFTATKGAGFPDHPHRGQETITYLQSGAIDHEDFAGNKGTLYPGDLQFMTAGRGIMHAEMPRFLDDGAPPVGMQLWVDLPENLKSCEPRYRDLRAKEIPEVKADDDKVIVKVISGRSYGVDSVRDLAYTPVWLFDVTIKPGGRLEQELPQGWNAFAYTYQGTTSFGEESDTTGPQSSTSLTTPSSKKTVSQYHNVVFQQQGDKVVAATSSEATEDSKFILVAGQPLDQKVVQYGPFVVTSENAVYQAMMDFQTNTNGFERAKGWASEIGNRSKHSFDVNDDVLAFPQFEVTFPDEYIPQEEASRLLAHTHWRVTADENGAQRLPVETTSSSTQSDPEGSLVTYEAMMLGDQRYLCEVPQVDSRGAPQPANATTLDHEQELAMAKSRGLELLSGLGDDCLYYMAGWWSYSFCNLREVRQFHALPPGNGVPLYPPQEDRSVKAYILGRLPSTDLTNPHSDSARRGHSDAAELQTVGDRRYLVQRLGHGSRCDLTDRRRQVEVQYHCSPHSKDHIAYIEETTTCQYLMVIYTQLLCQDLAFVAPPQDDANHIACRQVLSPAELASWEAAIVLAENEERELGEAQQQVAAQQLVIDDILVGGRAMLDSSRSGADGAPSAGAAGQPSVKTIASSKDGQLRALSPADLQELQMTSEQIERLQQDLEALADGGPWRLELVTEGEERTLRGMLDTEASDADEASGKRVAGADDSDPPGQPSSDTPEQHTTDGKHAQRGAPGDTPQLDNYGESRHEEL